MSGQIKQVTEIDSEQLQAIIEKIDQVMDYVKQMEHPHDASKHWITKNQFAEKIQSSMSQIDLMIAGKHPSGFHLRTHKHPNTRTVWIPLSEVNRFFSFGESPESISFAPRNPYSDVNLIYEDQL